MGKRQAEPKNWFRLPVVSGRLDGRGSGEIMSEKQMLEGDLQDQVLGEYHSDLGVTHSQVATLPGFATESGHEFKEIQIAYQTLGKLSPRRDNVILVCHALSGDAHMAGLNPATGRPGWWDFHVGPGKAIDTDRFFVVCPNVLGGCSGSTGPSSAQPGNRASLRHRLSAGDHPRHGARAGGVARPSPAPGNFRRHRRFDGRNAGAGLGDGLSGAGEELRADCHLHGPSRHADRLQ